MNEEPLSLEEQRKCALCERIFIKDEMYHVEINEPGAYGWLCEDCYEAGQP